MRVKAVVFDLDGTLVDSRKDIALAANRTLRDLGLPPLPEETIVSFVGGGVDTLVKLFLGPENLHRFEEALSLYRQHYAEGCTGNTALYPGVKEALDFLQARHIPLGLATNKAFFFTQRILQHLGVDGYFSIVLGPEHVKNRKPDPEIINTICQRLKVLPEEALYVGDSEVDVECGKRAGTYTCAVTYGFTPPAPLVQAKPDFLLCDLSRLSVLLA
ncbi:HAD family hydrolase [Moorellaceae bacterium AZ2]